MVSTVVGFAAGSCRQSTMRHSGTGQGQGNEQCFNSVFHTVFSLFVNSGITLTAVKTVNKWQMFRNGKRPPKATFFLLQLQSIFFARRLQDYCCSSASPIFDFRLFTQVTHQSFKDDLCVVLGDTLHHRFFSDLPALNLVSLHPAPAEPHYLAYRSPYRSSVCLSLAAAVQTQPG